MNSILDKIYEYKKIEVNDSYKSLSINELINNVSRDSGTSRSFLGSIRDNTLAGKISLVCEIKKRAHQKEF